MRQDEIAQFHLDDIRQDEEGIWLIDVNDRGDKKVKTKSARRLILVSISAISRIASLFRTKTNYYVCDRLTEMILQ